MHIEQLIKVDVVRIAFIAVSNFLGHPKRRNLGLACSVVSVVLQVV